MWSTFLPPKDVTSNVYSLLYGLHNISNPLVSSPIQEYLSCEHRNIFICCISKATNRRTFNVFSLLYVLQKQNSDNLKSMAQFPTGSNYTDEDLDENSIFEDLQSRKSWNNNVYRWLP